MNQEALDTSLARCSDEIQSRFRLLLGPIQAPVKPDDVVDASPSATRATTLGADLWELHDVLQPRRVGATGIALAEEACARLDASYAELPPHVLVPELRLQMKHVVGWMQESQPVPCRQRLCSLAARLAGLRAWVCFDMADYRAADAWFAVELSAADEAEDNDASGWLLGGQSLLPIERGDFPSAAMLLAEADARAAQGASSTTRAWLDILIGRAAAGLGDRRGFATADHRARMRLPATSRDDRHRGMDLAGRHLDVSYYEGLGHLLVGQPQAAATASTPDWLSYPTSVSRRVRSSCWAWRPPRRRLGRWTERSRSPRKHWPSRTTSRFNACGNAPSTYESGRTGHRESRH